MIKTKFILVHPESDWEAALRGDGSETFTGELIKGEISRFEPAYSAPVLKANGEYPGSGVASPSDPFGLRE